VKELRPKRGLTAANLAERMTELGIKWDRAIVANLESGRRRSVSVDELLGLALVLNVAPVHLLVPPDDDEKPYEITAKVTEPSFRVRGWIRGLFMLRTLPRVGAQREFFSEVPPDEFEAVQQGQCPCCGGRLPLQWPEDGDGAD
jgi:transcriptional regulator with XRE-family HTH domain